MQNPQNPYQPPPIASPDGRVAPPPIPNAANSVVRGDYKTAPPIVKSARALALLTIIVGALFLVGALMIIDSTGSIEASARPLLLSILCVGMGGWLSFGHRQGQSVAWTGQVVLSAIGLTGFPIGTLIHGYLLSKWFAPEVKAWYGRD